MTHVVPPGSRVAALALPLQAVGTGAARPTPFFNLLTNLLLLSAFLLAFCFAWPLAAQPAPAQPAPAQPAQTGKPQESEADFTFKSDVALVRVDAQVFDGYHRRVGNLKQRDFVLFDEGKRTAIRNFASEAAVMDILFLLDVSGSMRPNVQRVADAAGTALDTLRQDDRLAIMTFDMSSRVQMPFTGKLKEMETGFQRVLDRESFNGGTNIARGLRDAIRYMEKHGRPEARRAIVILTDDMTQPGTAIHGMSAELIRKEIVLNALLAPDMFSGGMGRPRRRPGGIGGGGVGWPGGRGGIGFPGGGIPGGGYPGGNFPGGGMNPNEPAGTADTAAESGGDSVSVEAASALEITLQRIRQCYALFFNGVTNPKPDQTRRIQLRLASATAAKYPGATIVYRQTYVSPLGDGSPVAEEVGGEEAAPESAVTEATPVLRRRRVAMNEPTTNRGPNSEPIVAEKTEAETPAAKPASPAVVEPDPAAPRPKRRAISEPSSGSKP